VLCIQYKRIECNDVTLSQADCVAAEVNGGESLQLRTIGGLWWASVPVSEVALLDQLVNSSLKFIDRRETNLNGSPPWRRDYS
jgi:hypothetical protein